MIRLIWSGVRFAKGRAAALAAGIGVAAVAFALLTASVDVGTARITGAVNGNWRGAYDLLVLPASSAQATGARKHLAQVNYLSAAGHGITMRQYRRIAGLPGIGVAAPLAVVGYLLETVDIPLALSPSAIGQSGARVLTVTSRYTADRGLSRYPPQGQGYVYITPDPLTARFDPATAESSMAERLPDGKTIAVCPSFSGPGSVNSQRSPFQASGGLLLGSCYSRGSQAAPVQGTISWSFPVLVAGIDPAAESQLTGLAKAVTSGRYLREGEKAAHVAGTHVVAVPLLGSSTSFDGDNDQVSVGLLPPAAVGVVRSGGSPAQVMRRLGALQATTVLREAISGAHAWSELLSNLQPAISADHLDASQRVGQYWTSGSVRYRRGSNGAIDPVPVTNPLSVWATAGSAGGQAFVPAPPAAADTGFRVLTEHTVTSGIVSASEPGPPEPLVHLVGEFAPSRLVGFAAGGPGSPLASYRAPLLTGADQASRRALGSFSLEPDGNMAGYAQQPPLLLTTLGGASALEAPAAFAAGNHGQAAAPIGSIRIRVSGLRGPVREKLAKIAAVAQEIRNATGLQVIVTAGASAQRVTIGLPAGQFGRPALSLAESWTHIGVALVVLRQADRESLALFVLILVVCCLFLGGAALAGVRGRRSEVGALRAFGWGGRQIFVLVLGEVAMLGIGSGAVGAALSAALIAVLRLRVPMWHAVLVLPVAAVLAVLAGLIPAALAARAQPRDALAAAARSPRRGGLPVRTVTGLAVTGILRSPGRCALAAAALGAGVAGLAVLLAAQVSFSKSVGDSALAGLVTASARSADLVAALLAVALGAVAVGDITYLNLRERAGELAALAASGWGRAQLSRLLGVESLITAAVGSAGGAVAGLAAAAAAFGLSVQVLAGAVAAALAGTVIGAACSAVVLRTATDRPLAAILAADE